MCRHTHLLTLQCTNPATVRKYFYIDTFPERTRRPAGGSILEPYLEYMELRFGEGSRNGLQLWQEIKERGYPGTSRQVSKWMSKRRDHPIGGRKNAC